MTQKSNAFTIVELLIVIVVIAILAAISIVAYNGIQQRARDSERQTELRNVEKALELYKIDNNEYPSCGSDNSTAVSSCNVSSLALKLVPTYIASIPSAPSGSSVPYWYARGWKKSGISHTRTDSYQDYSMGTYLETVGCPCSGAWSAQINYMLGNQ